MLDARRWTPEQRLQIEKQINQRSKVDDYEYAKLVAQLEDQGGRDALEQLRQHPVHASKPGATRFANEKKVVEALAMRHLDEALQRDVMMPRERCDPLEP